MSLRLCTTRVVCLSLNCTVGVEDRLLLRLLSNNDISLTLLIIDVLWWNGKSNVFPAVIFI